MEGESPAAKVAPAEPVADGVAVPAEAAKRILVRLLRDVPSFVGADLKTYGPYKSEDVVLLPAQNTDALVKRGIATEIHRR
jgi:DNA replication initiation complex subunit (GINS family)